MLSRVAMNNRAQGSSYPGARNTEGCRHTQHFIRTLCLGHVSQSYRSQRVLPEVSGHQHLNCDIALLISQNTCWNRRSNILSIGVMEVKNRFSLLKSLIFKNVDQPKYFTDIFRFCWYRLCPSLRFLTLYHKDRHQNYTGSKD